MKKIILLLLVAALSVCFSTASAFAAGKPAPAPVPAQTAIVAPSGGDYTSPVAAMANLSTWCGVPSAEKPCLLKVMPGVYDIGPNYILLPAHVDMEGSGAAVTKIKGFSTHYNVTEGGYTWIKGVVRLNGGNVRDLSVEADEDYTDAYHDTTPYGIEVRESAKIENVTVIAHKEGTGIYVWTQKNVGGQWVGGEVEIRNATVLLPEPIAWGTAIEINRTDRLKITDSIVKVSPCTASAGCTHVNGITLWGDENSVVSNSSVYSPMNGLDKSGTSFPAVVDLQVSAPYPFASNTTGFKCYGVYDLAWNPVACQ